MTARRTLSAPWLRLLVLAAWPAFAGFSSAAAFEVSANLGGGGGMTFVGSPTSHALSCTACHQGPAPTGAVVINANSPRLFSAGYVPGERYEFAVLLKPERQGLDRNGACEADKGGCNRNGFVAEFLGGDGQPIGQLCTDSGDLTDQGCSEDSGHETSLFGSARAVSGLSQSQPAICGTGVTEDCIDVAALLAAGKTQDEVDQVLVAAVKGRTSWRFQWRAPNSTGPVYFHLGVVDGDGGTRVSADHNDYYGDDTYVVARTVWPEGMAPAESTGCSTTRTPGLGGTWAAMLCAVLLVGLRRRRGATDFGETRRTACQLDSRG